MGKAKNQKSKNVFKVSGGRSAKAKNKLKSLDVERLKNVSTCLLSFKNHFDTNSHQFHRLRYKTNKKSNLSINSYSL